MSDLYTHSAEPPDPAHDWAQRCMAVLDEVLTHSLDMVRLYRGHAEHAVAAAQAPDAAPADHPVERIGLAFDRATRSLRHTIALGGRMADILAGRRDAFETRRAAGEAALRKSQADAEKAAAAAHRAEAVKRGAAAILEAGILLEDQIRAVSPYTEREALLKDLESLFDNEYEEFACADLAIPAIIDRLCRDIGIAPDWSKIPKEDLYSAERRAAAGQAVYATWPHDGNPPPRPEPPKPLSGLEDYLKHRYANEPPD